MDDIPPSYDAAVQGTSSPLDDAGSPHRRPPSLTTLPIGLLIRVLAQLTASELHSSVRRVCCSLYLTCMHLLRQHFEPAFSAQVRYPFTSNPLGRGVSASSASALVAGGARKSAVVPSSWRETRILDLFVARMVHQLVLTAESDLHLAALTAEGSSHLVETASRDLFDYEQPQSRCEDLFIARGQNRRIVSPSDACSFDRKGDHSDTIWPNDIGIRFSLRKVCLVLPCSSTSVAGAVIPKAVVEVTRTKTTELETSVDALLNEVDRLLAGGYLTRVESHNRSSYIRTR